MGHHTGAAGIKEMTMIPTIPPSPASWPSEIQDLADKWPSAFVARSEVARFSGGLLHPRTMANIDCEGSGPPRIVLGRKVAYPLAGICNWLATRIRVPV